MFLFGRKPMVAEIEGAPAGGSGPGAAAPAAPAAPAAAPGVRGSASPAGGQDGPFPRLFGRGAAPAPASGAGDDDDLDAAIRADTEGRGIPHDRVRTMRSSWEKRAREAALKEARDSLLQEFSPVLEELQQLRGMAGKFDPAATKAEIAKSILKGLGVEEEPPKPQFVTREELEKQRKEDRETFYRESQHRQDMERAKLDLQAAKVRHKEFFDHFPMLEELAAAVWSTPASVKHGLAYGSIIDAMVKQLEGGIGGYNKAYADRKQKELETETPIVPGSGPTPAPKPKDKVDHSTEGTAKRAVEFLRTARKAG